MLNAVIRGVFFGVAAVVAAVLVVLGLGLTALMLLLFLVRRLWARLLGRPQPHRPLQAHWRFHRRPWPAQRPAPGGEVIEAEVREISRSAEGG